MIDSTKPADRASIATPAQCRAMFDLAQQMITDGYVFSGRQLLNCTMITCLREMMAIYTGKVDRAMDCHSLANKLRSRGHIDACTFQHYVAVARILAAKTVAPPESDIYLAQTRVIGAIKRLEKLSRKVAESACWRPSW